MLPHGTNYFASLFRDEISLPVLHPPPTDAEHRVYFHCFSVYNAKSVKI
jgi:hypothetical protein